jgi:hypothetical protein
MNELKVTHYLHSVKVRNARNNIVPQCLHVPVSALMVHHWNYLKIFCDGKYLQVCAKRYLYRFIVSNIILDQINESNSSANWKSSQKNKFSKTSTDDWFKLLILGQNLCRETPFRSAAIKTLGISSLPTSNTCLTQLSSISQDEHLPHFHHYNLFRSHLHITCSSHITPQIRNYEINTRL